MAKSSTNTQALLIERVQPWVDKLPWQSTHPVLFDDSEGYAGKGVLGARAGPKEAIDFENLAHEMSHAIEIMEQGRLAALSRPNWGLRIKTVFHIAGRAIYEPITMQASERECEVCGIQLRLLELVSHPAIEGFSNRHATTLTKWMPDYIFGGDTEQARIATREQLIRDAYNRWPLARIEAAWRVSQAKLAAIHAPTSDMGKVSETPRRRLRA